MLLLLLAVFFQGHAVVLNGFYEGPFAILASGSGKCSIYVIWVELQNSRQILDALVNFPQFLVGAAPDVKRPGIARVYAQQLIAVIYGSLEVRFLHI